LENEYQEVNVQMIRNKEVTVECKYPIQNLIKKPAEMKMIIPNEYPFRPPEVYINDKNYLDTINNCHITRIKKLVQKYKYTTTCLRCSSSILMNNWSPVLQIKNIFEEIDKNNKLKRIIKYDLILEYIFKKQKSLPMEVKILIQEYLYL